MSASPSLLWASGVLWIGPGPEVEIRHAGQKATVAPDQPDLPVLSPSLDGQTRLEAAYRLLIQIGERARAQGQPMPDWTPFDQLLRPPDGPGA